MVRAAFPAGPDWAAVPGCPGTRPTGLLTAPKPRGGARGRGMPPCLCVCALVCLRGGGGAVAHLLAPLLFGVGAHGAGKCVPGAPGPGREAGERDSEPAGGDVGLSSQPPRHKDMLPNHSTTACWHGKAVVRGTTGVRLALLDCLRHRWCCHVGWVWLPTAQGVPWAGGGAPGRRECFPALGATGAGCTGCTGCGATARVDEGAQRAPHPNGLAVEERGGGQGSAGGCLASRGRPQLHWSARGCAGLGICDEVRGARGHLEVPWAGRSRDTHSGQAVSPSQPPLFRL